MRLIDKILPKKLKELYWNRKMSSPEIAKMYNSTPEQVRLLLRKHGIRIRTKSEARRIFNWVDIPKKQLRKLYLNNKMTTYEIAKNFECCQRTVYKRLLEYNIPTRPVQEALPLSNRSKHPLYNFSGNLEEKAYLIGFRQGDLHVEAASKRSSTIFIEAGSTKPEFIKIVEESFSPYGYIWKDKPNKEGVVHIRCSLNRSFNFLLDKKDLIEPWILKNTNYFAAFLAGYTDAEGTFCIYNRRDGCFSIRSQDKNILHQVRNKLILLKVLCRPPHLVRRKGTKDIRGTISNEDIYGLWVYRKDALLKLMNLLSPYLKHADKQRRVEIVKNNVFERNKKYNNQPDRRFYKLYLEESIKI